MFAVLRRAGLCLAIGLATVLAPPAGARDTAAGPSLRLGAGQLVTSLGGIEFEVFTFRPEGCARPSVLVVFHGNGRGAASYRTSAQTIAEEGCFVVYAPLFDRDRFPSWSYHRGGIVHDGAIRDPETWTVGVVGDLIDWIRSREGTDAAVYLFGHSAGAQYLSRVAAYMPQGAVERVILANPSTYVYPSLEDAAPYGFADLPAPFTGEERLRAYLAAPVTVYLGRDDTGSEDLTRNEAADRQGANRLERGRTVFEAARTLAAERDWPFGWLLVEVDGVGHTARGMLTADALIEALGFNQR